MANKKLQNEEMYPKLIIYKARRRGLFLLLSGFFVGFTGLLFNGLMISNNWLAIAGPVAILAPFIIFLPMTEEWKYQAWQIKARQYERHIKEK